MYTYAEPRRLRTRYSQVPSMKYSIRYQKDRRAR
jgi:hypothetical protein